ncbi:hypothetical protein [Borrelia coriaceae]|uniref:BDR-repeat family protein n=1 Tax=Borrelia coriaceae ATCC 43381 TaxID=1408429 RepID=W5SX47_9SPIR|nr:BDR-repeat family protein [Borrelia coriaceae ATCC 43381]
MGINKIELNNKINIIESNLNVKIDKSISELKGTLNLHNWMLGTIIILNVGILLTLMSIVSSLLNK